MVIDCYLTKQFAISLQEAKAVARGDVSAYVLRAFGERDFYAVRACFVIVVSVMNLRDVEVSVFLCVCVCYVVPVRLLHLAQSPVHDVPIVVLDDVFVCVDYAVFCRHLPPVVLG